MIAKDFILSLDEEKLFDIYYDTFRQNDIFFQDRAQKLNLSPQQLSRKSLSLTLSDIKRIEPKPNESEFLCPFLWYDYDINDDLSYTISEYMSSSILKKEDLKNLSPLPHIKSYEEVIGSSILFETYSLLFVPWEELLGMEFLYIPEDRKYEIAADFLHELTFMGYDSKTSKENSEKEMKTLSDRAKHSEEHPEELVSFDYDEFREKFGLPQQSEEEKILVQELSEKVTIDTHNKKIDVINKYIIPFMKGQN